MFTQTCVEDLVEEALDECGGDVKVREEECEARVAYFSQPQPLLTLLIHMVTPQHALKQLRTHTHTPEVSMRKQHLMLRYRIVNSQCRLNTNTH